MPSLAGPARRTTSILRLSLGLIALALVGLGLARGGPPQRGGSVSRARYLMGTVLEIEATGSDQCATGEALEAAFAAVEATEARLSNWRPESELSRANRDAADAPVRLSPATFGSLTAAMSLARQTGGAFDPSIGGVTRALGLTGGEADPPAAAALAGSVGWRHVRLDPRSRTIFFDRPGVAIDSGGFGKGEALDRAAAALRRRRVLRARLNFGGQILLLDAGRSGPSEITLAAPDRSGRSLARLRVGRGSVSTSGDSEKPGHLIDPGSGRPARFHGSVTVVADTGLRADALSTALFVMGPAKGLAFADREGIAALFAVRRGQGYQLLASRAFPRLERTH